MHELRVALWREIPSAHGNIKGAAASFGLEPTHASRKKSLFALSLPLLYSRIFMYKICEHKDVTLHFSVKTKPKKNPLFKMAISVFREKLDSGCNRLLTADVGTQVVADSCTVPHSSGGFHSWLSPHTSLFFPPQTVETFPLLVSLSLYLGFEQDTQIHFWNARHDP